MKKSLSKKDYNNLSKFQVELSKKKAIKLMELLSKYPQEDVQTTGYDKKGNLTSNPDKIVSEEQTDFNGLNETVTDIWYEHIMTPTELRQMITEDGILLTQDVTGSDIWLAVAKALKKGLK